MVDRERMRSEWRVEGEEEDFKTEMGGLCEDRFCGIWRGVENESGEWRRMVKMTMKQIK